MERNIKSYLQKRIEGAAKHYKKEYFTRKDHESLINENYTADYNDTEIIQDLFQGDLSDTDIFFAEELFDNFTLFKAYKSLTDKQKLVVYMKYVFELSEPLIAQRLRITRQAVSKRNKAALQSLLANYKG
jgi:DNA-directed RNA polymerase specialized sigma subunit